jgi:hypothetical protein
LFVKLGEVLAPSTQAAQKYDERFNLRKLTEMEVRKKYQIKISNRLAAWENLNDSEDINNALENTKEYIKSSAKKSLNLYALKQHTRSHDEECLTIFRSKEAD